MSSDKAIQSVPTLTEVVKVSDAAPVAEPVAAVPRAAHPVEAALAQINEERIVKAVLEDLQRQVDLMLEYRLREALSSILSRATDALMRDARNELASTLKDVVTRAVAQELARHRTP